MNDKMPIMALSFDPTTEPANLAFFPLSYLLGKQEPYFWVIISDKWTEWNWRVYCYQLCVSVCVCLCAVSQPTASKHWAMVSARHSEGIRIGLIRITVRFQQRHSECRTTGILNVYVQYFDAVGWISHICHTSSPIPYLTGILTLDPYDHPHLLTHLNPNPLIQCQFC